jgi:hypothetical protein
VPFGEYIYTQCDLIGPYSLINNVKYIFEGRDFQFSIHDFNFSKTFVISRIWQCGCCPHIFLKETNSEKWLYGFEALTSPMNSESFTHLFPNKLKAIMISEIEDEITYIEELSLYDKYGVVIISVTEIELCKNESLSFDIDSLFEEPYTLYIKGYYSPQTQTSKGPEARKYRNDIVRVHLKHLNVKCIDIPA